MSHKEDEEEQESVDKEHQALVEALANIYLGSSDQEESSFKDYCGGVDDVVSLKTDTVQNIQEINNNNNNIDNDQQDPFWWSPLEPEELGRGGSGPPISSEYLFTNEELVEALRHINGGGRGKGDSPTAEETTEEGEGNNNNNDHGLFLGDDGGDDEDLLLCRDWLFEDPFLDSIEEFRDSNINSDSGDPQLLLPLEDMDHIFDEQSDDDERRQTTDSNHKIADSFFIPLDPTEDILQRFQGLSLSLPPPVTTTVKGKGGNNDDDSSNQDDVPPHLQDFLIQTPLPTELEPTHLKEDKSPPASYRGSPQDIPPYLFCQPCGDPSGQSSTGVDFSTDHLFSLSLEGDDPQYLTDIDKLLAQLSLAQGEDYPYPATKMNQSDCDNPLNHQDDDDNNDPMPPPPQRPRKTAPGVLAAAQPLMDTFGVKRAPSGSTRPEPPPTVIRQINGERQCLGHRERILNAQFSPHGTFLATASADSTIRVWRSSNNRLLSTLRHHNAKYECLRVAWASPQWLDSQNAAAATTRTDPQKQDDNALLSTGGADGQVYILKKKKVAAIDEYKHEMDWDILARIDHSTGTRHFEPSDDDDRPQIYALQFVDNWQVVPGYDHHHVGHSNRVVLTSSENHIHVWELIQEPEPEPTDEKKPDVVLEEVDEERSQEKDDEEEKAVKYPWHFREVFSIGFGELHSMGYGVSVGRVTESASLHLPFTNTTAGREGQYHNAFGGVRNPSGTIFVFDAAYCPTNGLLGVALSDGSLRLLNGRGICLSVLQLPGVSSHLTSFCWDATGTQLATSVANTGHVITWEILLNPSKTDVQKTACRAILGGGHDRTVFGTRYVGRSKVQRGESDPLLLSWGVDGRVVVWDAQAVDEVDAPIATLRNDPDYPIYGLDVHEQSGYMAMVGGSGDGGFIGIPALLYDILPVARNKTTHERSEEEEEEGDKDEYVKNVSLVKPNEKDKKPKLDGRRE